MKGYRDLGAALAEADWEKLLPRLAAYAERKLFWRGWGIRTSRPSGKDIVDLAIERCLSGERKWAGPAPPTFTSPRVSRSLPSGENLRTT